MLHSRSYACSCLEGVRCGGTLDAARIPAAEGLVLATRGVTWLVSGGWMRLRCALARVLRVTRGAPDAGAWVEKGAGKGPSGCRVSRSPTRWEARSSPWPGLSFSSPLAGCFVCSSPNV